ncbi:MAG: cation-translocating P-type ATPase C-terminal domain-containing protein, partial [Candidatus Eremiobacterota bacterium]
GLPVAGLLLLVLDTMYQGGWLTMHRHDYPFARTAGFYLVVTARLWNSLNFLTLPGSVASRELWRTPYVPAACLASWLLTLGVIYAPPFQKLFDLVPLDLNHLIVLSFLALLVLIPGEVYKAVVGVRMNHAHPGHREVLTKPRLRDRDLAEIDRWITASQPSFEAEAESQPKRRNKRQRRMIRARGVR